MTCILGIASSEPRSGLRDEVERMLSAVHTEPWYQSSCTVDTESRVGIGRLAHGYADLGQAAETQADLSLTLFGDVYALPGDAQVPIFQQVLEGYASQGERFFGHVQGAFIAVLFDSATGVLRVFNDRFGQRPLYYYRRAGRLSFSTALPALFAAGTPQQLNPAGMAQFFAFGHYFGCDTLYQDISVLPAGSVLEFQTRTGEVQLRPVLSQRTRFRSYRLPTQAGWKRFARLLTPPFDELQTTPITWAWRYPVAWMHGPSLA